MPHHTPLIATIVVGIVLAFALGAIANRLRISPIVGYLLAGVLVGPHTPGFVADQALAAELAEIGVILLMFGVGLHFSLKDLLSVKAIAIPGALGQMAVATALGLGLGLALGWPLGAGIVFGLALSVASTVVLLRALQERHLLDSERGRIAVGWLVVEDLAMVLALVLLPALAGVLGAEGAPKAAVPFTIPGIPDIATSLAVTIAKIVAFVAMMLVVGRRVIPWVLHRIVHTGNRELFRLAVLAISLGVAYGCALLFDVSFALGAFFAGMILGESELSQRAADETLPLRDAFAVLFFVSVGMLFDPAILLRDPLPVLGALAIVMLGKSAAALLIVLAFRRSMATALTISASLAQIGEFSFILATLGLALKLLPEQARDLILAGAILSIMANPALFVLIDRITRPKSAAPAVAEPLSLRPTTLQGHAIVVGYGRVGRVIGEGLRRAGVPFVVLETSVDVVTKLRAEGVEAQCGNAAEPTLLEAANVAGARLLFVAIPIAFEAGQVIEQARRANPTLSIIARAHFDAEVAHLAGLGANAVVMGEREIAAAMVREAFPPPPGAATAASAP
ncbi:MAG: Kef family K(+) transporter [Candidatus Odyssella sp.]|nr:Kef family K(+) transporter [Candidatus Odyssella sp.]